MRPLLSFLTPPLLSLMFITIIEHYVLSNTLSPPYLVFYFSHLTPDLACLDDDDDECFTAIFHSLNISSFMQRAPPLLPLSLLLWWFG